MRPFITTILILFSPFCFGQVTTKVETIIVDSGKYEFKIQAKKDTPNYSVALRILTNQVKLKPKDAELRYFLGYTIDRLNADDGKRILLFGLLMKVNFVAVLWSLYFLSIDNY